MQLSFIHGYSKHLQHSEDKWWFWLHAEWWHTCTGLPEHVLQNQFVTSVHNCVCMQHEVCPGSDHFSLSTSKMIAKCEQHFFKPCLRSAKLSNSDLWHQALETTDRHRALQSCSTIHLCCNILQQRSILDQGAYAFSICLCGSLFFYSRFASTLCLDSVLKPLSKYCSMLQLSCPIPIFYFLFSYPFYLYPLLIRVYRKAVSQQHTTIDGKTIGRQTIKN